jgi:hypothetical protein
MRSEVHAIILKQSLGAGIERNDTLPRAPAFGNRSPATFQHERKVAGLGRVASSSGAIHGPSAHPERMRKGSRSPFWRKSRPKLDLAQCASPSVPPLLRGGFGSPSAMFKTWEACPNAVFRVGGPEPFLNALNCVWGPDCACRCHPVGSHPLSQTAGPSQVAIRRFGDTLVFGQKREDRQDRQLFHLAILTIFNGSGPGKAGS